MTAVRLTAAAALGLARRVRGGLGLADDRDGHRVAARLASRGFFAAVWVAMMAAMMPPGVAPAWREPPAPAPCAVPLFAGSYLAVWALAGTVVVAAVRPYGSAAAGAVTIAAGAYEAISP